MIDRCIIVGGGHGGAQLCASLRQSGYSGQITLVSKENCLPYHRPPLSKAFLKNVSVDTQIIKPQAFYDDNEIELLFGREVIGINRESNEIELKDGGLLNYSKLVLALGARARLLHIPGAEATGVHYLKFADDAVQLRNQLAEANNISVIGGGFIGLEAAATFVGLGKKVTVYEAGDRLLGRAVSPEISAFFLDQHRANDMDIRLNASVEKIVTKNNKAIGVKSDGLVTNADIVLIGIGVVSNCEIAEDAGLNCKNGIEVDQHMRTLDHDILAVGDCVSFKHWQTDTRVRLESVQNANDQARNAALTLTGNSQVYSAVPWFWSDQGENKLQIVGLSNNADRQVVKSQSGSGSISVFHFKGADLVAIDTVNNQVDHMTGRRMMSGMNLPNYSEVNASDFDFRAFFKAR